ncbi:MAG: hypothetical protein M0R06_20150 [Sphaerochaeta sp.]|jgi:hypothetical protein|nr:hypothetical protein [Sphaerochaeta sp.]
MSLYNLLHGFNRNAPLALALVGVKAEETGRFRDAWIEEDGRHVSVFTRNGGGNREEYQETIDGMAKNPLYVEDFDDDFDCTYATIRFSIPERYHDLADTLKPEKKTPTLLEKTNAACEAIGKMPEDAKDEIAKRSEWDKKMDVSKEYEKKIHATVSALLSNIAAQAEEEEKN